MQLLGFPTCKETKLRVSSFLTEVKLENPKLSIETGKVMIKPTYLTDFEGVLAINHFAQNMPHRTKLSLQFSVSRQSMLHQTSKWLPMWEKFGKYLSVLPILHVFL